MRLVVVEGVEPGGVAGAVDARTYARGALLARRRAVVEMDWDGRYAALHTVVRDEATFHEAVVCFVQRGARLHFAAGTCTCRVGTNCAHVVASVLTSVGGGEAAAGAEQQPSWERTLRSLFAPEPPSLADLRDPVPLALELSLSAARVDSVTLSARIVRPGRTGWVAGGLTLAQRGLALLLRSTATPTHVRVLRELYALHNAGSGLPLRRVRPDDRPRHGRARALVRPRRGGGRRACRSCTRASGSAPSTATDRAELCLDVTAGPAPEALEIAPALRFDGADGRDADALPILFLGAEGHGVVHVSRAEAEADPDPGHWRFRLARLATPAPPPLRRLVVEDGGFSVAGRPAEALPRRVLPPVAAPRPGGVVGRVVHPAARPRPTLVLRAAYGGGHALALEWEWAYAVGDTQARFPLPSPGRGRHRPRSRAGARGARRARPPAVRGRPAAGRRPPLAPAAPRPARRARHHAVQHRGPAPARRRAGVVVEVDGSPAAYRETGDLAAGRRLHHGVGRRAPTGSTWASGSASRAATCRSPRSSPPSPRGSRTCSCRTGRTSRCTSRSCRRCARSSRRPARCRTRRRARCGSAASRRACGRSWPRSASSTPRREPGSSRSRACWRSTGSRRPHSRPASARSCGPTSARGSTGCASCGGTGSAACSPTTWGWARRCRRWP